MAKLISKSIRYGIIFGAVITIIYSLLTASVSGWNVLTGEPVELRGFRAVYLHLNEYGLASYLISITPTFLVVSLLVAVTLGAYLWSKQ